MRLEVRENALHLSDCQNESVKNIIRVLGGEKNKLPSNYVMPITLDAIQYFERMPDCTVDPSVIAYLDDIRARLEIAKTPGGIDYPFRDPPPFDHQKITFWFSTHLNVTTDLLATGLGKTRCALDIACYRHMKDGVNRVLIVAPMSIHKQWYEEIIRFTTVPNLEGTPEQFDNHPYIRVIRGSKSKRLRLLSAPLEEGKLTLFIIHYEALRVLKKELIDLDFEMVIADEATQIKNHQAKQAKAAKKIGAKAKYKLELTGTPIWNRPVDIFSQYQFLDPFWFGNSFMVFKNTFLMSGSGPGQAVGYKNLDEMTRRLYSIGIRFKKEDCLKDLPQRIYEPRRVEMTAEQKKLYEQAKEEFVVFIEDAQKQGLPRAIVIQNALVRLLKLQQICCGHAMDENRQLVEIPTNKPKEVLGILDEIMGEPDKKVIIWCRFVHDIVTLYSALADKYKCAKYYGGMKQEEKDAVMDEFRGKRKPDQSWELGPTQILIAQIRTGGVGLDLWMSDTAIFYSVEWSLGVREQAEGRNFRKGSEIHQSVTYFDIVCENSIEERILAELKSKKELSDLIMEAKDLKKLL